MGCRLQAQINIIPDQYINKLANDNICYNSHVYIYGKALHVLIHDQVEQKRQSQS